MPRPVFDCIVIGSGGFGSSAVYHLARMGVNVLGLEQFSPAHALGSSHGETRIIRQAYFEHPDYVPLLVRGYDLFHDLEQASGKKLFDQCGLFLAGPPEGETIQGARLARQQHQIPLEEVTAADFENRFPGYVIPDGYEVVFESIAGFLHVEETVRTHIEEAEKAGAQFQFNTTVRSWKQKGNQFVVLTDTGEVIARKLIITAGAWSSDLLSRLNVPLQVRRKVLCWHPVRSPVYDRSQGAGCFFYEMPEGQFYGFPSLEGKTVKLAEHTGGQDIEHPDGLVRTQMQGDGAAVARFIEQCLPQLDPRAASQVVCMYTMTTDQHFLVDEHPEVPGLYFGAGFSGHGFKFTSVIGEVLAELVSSGRTEHPVQFLGLSRFA